MIEVSANVLLAGVTDTDIEKSLYTDATVLSLIGPNDVIINVSIGKYNARRIRYRSQRVMRAGFHRAVHR